MNNKKVLRLFALLIVLCMISVFSGCGSNEKSTVNDQTVKKEQSNKEKSSKDNEKKDDGEVYNLKLSHCNPESHHQHFYATTFSEICKQKSNGKLIVDVYPAEQLGGLKDSVEGVNYGTIDMAISDSGTISTMAPIAATVQLPFLFNDLEHVERLYEHEIMDTYSKAILAKTDIRCLSFSHAGIRYVCSKKPINKFEDFKLLKIRVPEIPLYVDIFKSVGANPTPIPYGEIYTSLQTDVIEAAENTTTSFYASKWYEVADYVIPTKHLYVDIELIINEGKYQELPENLKTVIKEAAQEAAIKHRSMVGETDAENLEKLLNECGMEQCDVSNEMVTKFQEAVSPVIEEFTSKVEGSQEILDIIDSLK